MKTFSRGRLVDGFDYVAQRKVSMTIAEWQETFPTAIFQRRVEDGETFYRRPGQKIAAEAYANIPSPTGDSEAA